jgi:hypothetical protein
MQVREENPLNILPSHSNFRQTLQRSSSGIEKKLLIPDLHQGAWPESVHHWRRTAGTQKRHFNLLCLRGGWGNRCDKQSESHSSEKANHYNVSPGLFPNWIVA